MATGAHDLRAGHVLGQYEIVSPLTSGGMAAVYLGRHRGPAGFARHVAIKVVHPRYADDPQFVAMFLDEARLSSRIEHANVVRVEALGEQDGLYYLVMEYIRGAPLQRFIRRLAESQRALQPSLVVHIVAHVADGLHAAHETTDEHGSPLGIVHRDVTPQNVLISYAGAIKLIDFGIAKAAGRSQHTAKGVLKGKLRYMAPEQAGGRSVDRRTDVYALGIVLWEMLTYRKLFSAGSDVELIRKVLHPEIPAPSRFAPSLTPALDWVVQQALAPSPSERFQSALALRRALYEACPEARAIEAQELSVLMRATLALDIANEARSLPPSVITAAPMGPVVDASREEAVMTRIVPSIELFDEEGAPPVAAEPPALVRPESPASAPLQAIAAPTLPSAPALEVSAQSAPPAARPIARPFVAPAPVVPAPARATFTPAAPVLRSEGGVRPSAVAAVTREPLPEEPQLARARPGMVVALVLLALLTIALGGVAGWYAIHHASRLLAP